MRRSKGFNLVEVMVALIIISVGLLGIAKMQALAMSSTGAAKMKSLASLEAASLASSIRADREYWSNVTVLTTVVFDDGVVTSSTDGALMSGASCEVAGACPVITDMVSYNLQKWGADLATQMPKHKATLACAQGSITVPVTCTVVLKWAENRVAVNQQSTGETALANQYTLYVEP